MKEKPVQDHSYPKTKKDEKPAKKQKSIEDPKQRKISFSKVPSTSKLEHVNVISSDSESDQPLSILKNTNLHKKDGPSCNNSNSADARHPETNMMDQKILIRTLVPVIQKADNLLKGDHIYSAEEKVSSGKKDSSSKSDSASAKKNPASAKKEISSSQNKDESSTKEHSSAKKILFTSKKDSSSSKKDASLTKKDQSSSKKDQSSSKKEASTSKKEHSSSKKHVSSVIKDKTSVKKKPSSSKKDQSAGKEKSKILKKKNLSNGIISSSHGKGSKLIELTSDSDSDLDVPLAKLKDSPKFKSIMNKSPQVKPADKSKSAQALKMMAQSERSPKVKISCAKSPKVKLKAGVDKDLKQRTLFDYGAHSAKGPLVFKPQLVKSQNASGAATQNLTELKPKLDWKNLSEEEREKIRQEKRDEWNKARRERNKSKNLKYDDLELTNIPALPAGKPIVMPEGLPSQAFGDIAMIVEFAYTFNKFLAPEESPSITAELLMKALAAGSQGANVVSQILLILLRALISEEEREVNGLGIGLADMPLTLFTVSELVYYYLKFTCGEQKRSTEEEVKDDNDDGSSVGSREDEIENVTEITVPQRVINTLEKDEFFKLSAADQLKVLMFLFNKIIDSEYFLDYLENLKLEAKELWHQQDEYRKKTQKVKKDEPNKLEDKKQEGGSNPPTMLDKLTALAIPKTDDKKQSENNSEPSTTDLENKTGKENGQDVDKDKAKEVVDQPVKKSSETVADSKDDDFMKDYPKEPVADLVHIVRQRRIMAAKQAALKDEEERKEKERRKELEEIQLKMKKMQAWRDGLERCKKSLRLEPLGVDRHFKLYWVFSGGMPGIYVEDGWMYHAGEKRTIDSWEFYDTIEGVEGLMKTLTKQGIRESALRMEITTHWKSISTGIKKKNPGDFELKPYNLFEESLKVLKEDMIESGNRIVRGVLGIIANHEDWEKQVQEAKTVEEIVPLVLELQQGIFLKFLEGAMGKSKGEKIVLKWQENVKQVKTLPALHTLFGILENSVKWDKSSENAKCKICRRKAGVDYLVLCDECNRGYHPYCLRPALLDIPSDNWKCPACAPLNAASRPSRSSRREIAITLDEENAQDEGGSTDEEEEDSDEDEEEGEEESDHESLCHVCGEDGELICCDQCPKVYHLDCHEPPIRRLPRGMWICFICRNPKARLGAKKKVDKKEKVSKSKSKARPNKRGRPKRRSNRKGVQSSDDDDEEEQSESEENSEEEKVSKSKSRARTNKRGRPRARRSVQTSEDDEDEEQSQSEEDDDAEEAEEGEEDYDVCEPARKTRKSSRKSSKRSSLVSTEDSEEEEDTSISKRKQKSSRKQAQREETKKRGRKAVKKTTRPSRRKSQESDDEEMQSETEADVATRPSKSSRGKRKTSAGKRVSDVSPARASKRKKLEDTKLDESNDFNTGRRSSNQRKRNRRQNSEITACEDILRGMWKNENAIPFRNPVDPRKVPDYGDYVESPIDLSTIRDKLEMLEYEDAFQFAADVKLLFKNSRAYNEDASQVGQAAIELENTFFELVKEHLPGLHSTLCDDG